MASTIILSDNGASSGSAGLKETGGNDGVLILQTTTSGGTATNAVYADTKQNVGINFTPNTGWYNGGNLQLGAYSAVYSNGYLGACELASNAYRTSTTAYNYVTGNYASMYRQWDGKHQFYSAASGSADASISYTAVLQVSKDNTVALQGASFPVAGTGITFPATQSASSDANTLDDYEEGTFTPTINHTGGGSFSGIGKYTKIGRVVNVNIDVRYNASAGTGNNLTTITGLPFTNNAGLSVPAPVGLLYLMTSSGTSNISFPGFIVSDGSSSINLYLGQWGTTEALPRFVNSNAYFTVSATYYA